MNIFTRFLSLLKVRHTVWYSTDLYEQHPYKDTLYGLSQMLSFYNIDNDSFKLNDKSEFHSLSTPFIVQLNNDFVIVKDYTLEDIKYIKDDKQHNMPYNDFIDKWNGIVLLTEVTGKSNEPEYSKNKTEAIFISVEKIALALSIVGIILFSFIKNEGALLLPRVLLTILNILGLYISFLLLLKQINIGSRSFRKICSLFGKNSCDDVLETSASKFMGIIGWSEIGVSYFFVNIITIAILPSHITELALLNTLVLPYTFWSVWYQKFRLKKWCALCMIVQLTIWLIVITYILFDLPNLHQLTILNFITIVMLYLAVISLTNLILPIFINARRVNNLIYRIDNLKMREEVFVSQLKIQKHYDCSIDNSDITLGNIDSKLLVTIFTNPHCRPCAELHKAVDELIDSVGDDICIQYVFSSFNNDLKESSLFLISLYQSNKDDTVFIKEAFKEWYSGAKDKRKLFFEKYSNRVTNEHAEQEYAKHVKWSNSNGLSSTPTILINGYQLPENYNINDIKHFVDLEIVTPETIA